MSGRGTGQKRTRSSVTLGGRFTDNLLGIVWKECRRSVYQSSQFDDGRRKLLVVERILPASPAASSSALRPGDKLVSLTMDGMHRDTIGEGIASYSEFLLTLEEVREARIEMLGVSTLFNFKASNSHKGSRNTFSVLLSLKQPGSKGVRSQHAHHGRQSMSRGGSRPSTQSSSSSLTPRPQTSSWRVSEDARDPRSTRPLNAQRFERLVFMVNRHLKDPAVLQLLSQSYEVDRPPSSLSPSQSLAGPIALSLRPCYRLNRWWNQEEVLKMKFCLAAMKKHSDSVKLMDVLEILESHISESENYQDVLGEWMEEACCLLQASIRRLRTRRLVQGEEHGRPSTADEDVRNTLMMMEKSSNLLVDSVLEEIFMLSHCLHRALSQPNHGDEDALCLQVSRRLLEQEAPADVDMESVERMTRRLVQQALLKEKRMSSGEGAEEGHEEDAGMPGKPMEDLNDLVKALAMECLKLGEEESFTLFDFDEDEAIDLLDFHQGVDCLATSLPLDRVADLFGILEGGGGGRMTREQWALALARWG